MAHRLPVSVLDNNIVYEFEKLALANGYTLQADVDSRCVHGEIEIVVDASRPRGPYVDHIDRKIRVFESHLALLWAYIYSAFVIYELGVQEPMMAGKFDGELHYDGELLARARNLQIWAYGFSTGYKEWDTKSLPNPVEPLNSDEEFYVLKANALYLQAVCTLLMHEYAHLVQGHLPGVPNNWSLDQEKEADSFALRFLLGASESSVSKQIVAISSTLLYTSCLLMVDDIGSIWQQSHPHLHYRVVNVLSAVALEDQCSKDYVFYLAGNMLRDHANWLGAKIASGEHETPEAFFFCLLDQIDELSAAT